MIPVLTNGTMEGETKITVTDKNYTSVKSVTDTITIKEGTIKVFSNSGPVGPISVKVKLLDSSKEILTEDDSTTFTVTLDEFMKDNDSATSTATTSPVTVTDGVATIVIEDTEPETVTVTPLSDPELISVSGQVRFGTVSGSGLRKDWERELRKRDEYKKHEEE